MATTLITLLALNAASTGTGEHPVFWVTLPAAFLMFCWDVGCGWESRHTTREIAKFGDKKRLQALAVQQANPALTITTSSEHVGRQTTVNPSDEKESQPASADGQLVTRPESIVLTIHEATQCPARAKEQATCDPGIEFLGNAPHVSHAEPSPASLDTFGSEDFKAENMDTARRKRPRTLVGSCRELVDWLRSHISCYHGRLVASSLGTHPFRLCHVCARAGAGVEALGGHVCVRVETLGRQDGRCRWYRRHGISICRSV